MSEALKLGDVLSQEIMMRARCCDARHHSSLINPSLSKSACIGHLTFCAISRVCYYN